ncbi:unnamed protein product, partial [Adineta ricciae]
MQLNTTLANMRHLLSERNDILCTYLIHTIRLRKTWLQGGQQKSSTKTPKPKKQKNVKQADETLDFNAD